MGQKVVPLEPKRTLKKYKTSLDPVFNNTDNGSFFKLPELKGISSNASTATTSDFYKPVKLKKMKTQFNIDLIHLSYKEPTLFRIVILDPTKGQLCD